MKHELRVNKLLKYLVYTIFFFLSLGQLGRISFNNQEINIYIHEIFIFISICIWIWAIANDKKLRNSALFFFKTNPIVRALFVFLVVLFVSLVWQFTHYTQYANIIGFLYFFRLVLYSGYFLMVMSFEKRIINHSLVIFTVMLILGAVLQYIFYSNLRNLYYLGWDPHHYRVFGTFFDTTIMGMILLVIFFWVLSQERVKSSIKLIRHGGLIILFLLILLTYSRITYISFFIGLSYFFIKSRPIALIILIAFFLLIIPFLPRPGGEGVKLERSYSISTRIKDYEEGLVLFRKHPLLGVGYNRLMLVRQQNNKNIPSHSRFAFSSTYVTILATSGIVGLIFLLNLLISMFWHTIRLGRTMVIIISIASFFDNVILTNFVLLLFFVMISLSIKDPLYKKL